MRAGESPDVRARAARVRTERRGARGAGRPGMDPRAAPRHHHTHRGQPTDRHQTGEQAIYVYDIKNTLQWRI